jgi:putative NADH-flavin reductase
MNILVIGTRGIGKEVIKQAIESGHNVTILSRHPENVIFTGTNVTVFMGDATKIQDVEKASKGQDIIINAMGVLPSKKDIFDFSESASIIINAVKKNNVKLFIAVTGIGAGDSKGYGGFFYDRIINPLLLKKIYEDKDRMEAIIKASDINWIIVRPGFLTNGKMTQKYRVLTVMKGAKCGSISRADTAHFILTQAASRTFVKQTPLITY